MIARIWQFDPPSITVPAGSRVTFEVATPDVTHGFRILGTNVNVMIVPGEISRMEHRFTTPGEYEIVCYEYCGVGHQAMHGTVIVEETS
jgi:cytochrome c oxidase subunit 2